MEGKEIERRKKGQKWVEVRERLDYYTGKIWKEGRMDRNE